MSRVLYGAYGQSGATKNNGISASTKNGRNGLDVNVLGNDSNDFSAYEAKTFTITGATTNTNIKTTESLFGTVVTAKEVRVYSDIATTIKLNSTDDDSIVTIAGEEITFKGLPVTNLFITTSGNTVVRVIILA